ncbi:MAG: type II secretion system minor pseudopilin GspH [Thiomicrorhabdus sp.]|nr:type II secretion system minor pseudopilin GspH [Thiomicrorhabdus sp.]
MTTSLSKKLANHRQCAKPSASLGGSRALRQPRGFTLLELIVVILIIGLLISMVTISVGTSTDKSLETETKRFASLMKLASDESILNARPIAVQLGKQSYQFTIAGEVDNDDPIFRPREIAEQIQLVVMIEDEIIDFDELEEENFANIYIFPSGEMTPFSIIFSQDDGAAYEVTGNFFGKIEFVGKVQSPDE